MRQAIGKLLCFSFIVCGVVFGWYIDTCSAAYRLLTIEVDEGYASYKMAFASTYVADSVSGECESLLIESMSTGFAIDFESKYFTMV